MLLRARVAVFTALLFSLHPQSLARLSRQLGSISASLLAV